MARREICMSVLACASKRRRTALDPRSPTRHTARPKAGKKKAR
jgi:hypothetical protein